jgi:Glyoxalase-like domain
MCSELDHLFICVDSDAPAAERFVRFGLREAPSNRHPGQGTASRRVSFANAMIELLWVSDAGEAQSELAKPTLLWERWSGRHCGALPFGICMRPTDPERTDSPFPASSCVSQSYYPIKQRLIFFGSGYSELTNPDNGRRQGGLTQSPRFGLQFIYTSDRGLAISQ